MAFVEHRLPRWIKPQLTRLADEAPGGSDWLHEIKYDGYRMHARIDSDKIQLLTRTGLDWSHRYKRTIEALRALMVKSAYLDGELCALNADGVPVFSRLQAAMDEGHTDQLVFFAFDLLFLNGKSTVQLPLIKRKERLERLFSKKTQAASTSLLTVPAFASTPASWDSKASSQSGSTGHTRLVTAESGSSRSASIARSSLLLVGPTRREAGDTSAPCFWVTTPKMDACTMLVAQAPEWERRS
jgi:ATP-dependent DNA ligase